MTFTCTYRNAQGAPTTEVIEAASRADAFVQLKARGIAPTRVVAGGKLQTSGTHAPDSPLRRPAGPLRGALAGLCVVAAGVGAWFCLAPKGRPAGEKPQPAEHVKAKPVVQVAKPATNAAPVRAEEPQQPLPETVPARDENLPESVVTNKSGYIIETYLKDGKRTKVVREPPPVFENPADQVIAWMMSAQPGQEIPPFPIDKSIEEDFKRSLTNSLAVLDTDDEQVAALKRSVLATRQELVAMLEKGYTVQEALTEHRRLVNDNAKIRTEALLELQRIKAEGDLEGARKYVFKMNAAFQQMGVAPLPEVRTADEPAPVRRGHSASQPGN